mmetsp:Transcript_28269/g.33469  ORF Transcript_28269/g.33469 Transcript_28269/m.33469 type:complete len:217 (+) Transcript_28269:1188-1838(+)
MNGIFELYESSSSDSGFLEGAPPLTDTASVVIASSVARFSSLVASCKARASYPPKAYQTLSYPGDVSSSRILTFSLSTSRADTGKTMSALALSTLLANRIEFKLSFLPNILMRYASPSISSQVKYGSRTEMRRVAPTCPMIAPGERARSLLPAPLWLSRDNGPAYGMARTDFGAPAFKASDTTNLVLAEVVNFVDILAAAADIVHTRSFYHDGLVW